MRYIFLIFIILCLACRDDAGQLHHRNTVNVALIDNPTNLDPRLFSDAASFRIIELVYDFLVRFDTAGMPQPSLARKWENPSDTVYIFYLHPGVTFHDGMPLTAYDVAFTFQSILDPQLKAPFRRSFEVIKKIEVLDFLTIRFVLKYPYSPFVSNTMIGVVPSHIAESDPQILQRKPLGSGPFTFVRWKSDLYIELAANPAYWKSPPHISELEIKILPEETTRILALENREIDFMMNNFPESFIRRFQKNPALKVQMETGSNYVYLGTNLKNRFLKDVRVRQAIAWALDVRGIIDNLMAGIHQPAVSLLNPSHWAFNPNLSRYDYHPEKAKILLDDAGFPDPDGAGPLPRFTLNYKCTDKHASRQKAQLVQQYLGEVGIQVEIQSYEWGTFFDDIQNGRFDLYSLTWVGIYEPDLYYHIFHTDNIGVGANRGGYSNQEVDSLIVKAQQTMDLVKRRKYYWRIQQILNQELPYIHLWYETNVAVMDRRLIGFRLFPAAEWVSFSEADFGVAAE